MSQAVNHKIFIKPELERVYRAIGAKYVAGEKPAAIRLGLSIDRPTYQRGLMWCQSHGLVPRQARQKRDDGFVSIADFRPRQIRDWPDLPVDAFK